MRLLLDTHVVLWALAQPKRLAARERALLADSKSELFVSAASLFEIAARAPAARRRGLDISAAKTLQLVQLAGYHLLAVEPAHAVAAETIALFHSDPFDRLLLAQAQVEGLRLVTHDTQLAAFDSRAILF